MTTDGGRTYDVGVVGGLAEMDLMLAEALTRRGYRCTVLVRPRELERRELGPAPTIRSSWDRRDLAVAGEAADVLRWARRCRLIVSLSGALAFALRGWWPIALGFGRWGVGRRSLLPPVIGYATGSDVAELAVQGSLRARVLRTYLRWVDVNWISPYPHAVRNAARLGLPRVVFMGFPYDVRSAEEHPPSSWLPRPGPLRILHPAHLDWGVNDPGSHRRSTKGNDRFLRALARALERGLDADCLILDRGPDRAEAKGIVSSHPLLTQRVRWLPHLSRPELFDRMREADVVVDQFDVGGMGGIAIEAMALAKPVIMHVDARAAALQYGHDLPPVLNCRTEDEILDALTACRRPEALRELGDRARDWSTRHHRWDHCLDKFDFYFATLTRSEWPLPGAAAPGGRIRESADTYQVVPE